MPADDDRHLGRERADLRGKRQHVVGFERVHRGDADERGPGRAHLVLERSTEAEIGQRDAMAAGFERRGDVLHAERLDAKEGTEAEPLVAGNGTQQQHIHARGARVTRDPDAILPSLLSSWPPS